MSDYKRYGHERGYGTENLHTHFHQRSTLPLNPVLAMAYVPIQTELQTYDCDKALQQGTLFPCLDKPFQGGCCK